MKISDLKSEPNWVHIPLLPKDQWTKKNKGFSYFPNKDQRHPSNLVPLDSKKPGEGSCLVLHEETGIAFIDLDNVRNPDTSEIIPEAQKLVDRFNSYAEISFSGTGVHIICSMGDERLPNQSNGAVPFIGDSKIELYTGGRLCVWTDKRLNGIDEIRECPDLVKSLHEKYWPERAKTPTSTPRRKLTDGNTEAPSEKTLRFFLKHLGAHRLDNEPSWWEVMIACKGIELAGVDYDVFEVLDDISAAYPGYDRKGNEQKWREAKPKEGGITFGSIVQWASVSAVLNM